MTIRRLAGGCLVIPDTEIAAVTVAFTFVIVLIVVGNAVGLSGADVAGVIVSAGALIGSVTAALSPSRARRSDGLSSR